MFTYEPLSDTFICPAGQRLGRQGKESGRPGLDRYPAGRKTCLASSLKAQCTVGTRRTVRRHLDPSVLEWARVHLETPQARLSMRKRQAWAETEFAEEKNWHGLRRARYRRRWRVSTQVLLIATAQNLKKLARALAPQSQAACGIAATSWAGGPLLSGFGSTHWNQQ
ncbi:MAG: transposase [Dehalococcoidia bacterium]